MNNLSDLNGTLVNLSALAVFKNFLSDIVGIKFLLFLESVVNNDEFYQVTENYTEFINELYNSDYRGDWSKYVKNFILTDENSVSKDCARGNFNKVPSYILGAFEYELRILSDIASISFENVRELLLNYYPDAKDFINSLPAFESDKLLFTKDVIQEEYKTKGYGIISKYRAFKFDLNLELQPVIEPDDISFDELKLYEYQKNIIKNNTISFLKGNRANNILLYGDRGCGKSSSVKAVCFEYRDFGLKIIQIYKENLGDIEKLLDYLSGFPSKFILFVDDLVFDENDPDFASTKAVLEGSLSKHPDNVLLYVTTNRRHLIKESFSSREGNEVHLSDTMDEAASLSDRFGLTITFSSPDKKNYLEIVKLLAHEFNINVDDKLLKEAEAFALLKGNRAPRIARQFLADFLANMV